MRSLLLALVCIGAPIAGFCGQWACREANLEYEVKRLESYGYKIVSVKCMGALRGHPSAMWMITYR